METHFSKENISRRLRRRAAELWGQDESLLDQFDPLVKLLLDACSVELEKVGQEIQTTETRLITRLAEILSPETNRRPVPASAIATARPLEPKGRVTPENQFVYRRTNAGKGEPAELYFSPVSDFPVVNAAVMCYATPGGLFSVEKGNPVPLSDAAVRKSGEQEVWIGVEMDPGIVSWDGFRFYFDWKNNADRFKWIEYIPLIGWEVNGKHLETSLGMEDSDQLEGPDRDSFVRITDESTWEKGQIRTFRYPEVFEDLFDDYSLQTLKRELVWIKATFPAVFPFAGFADLSVALNAFPIVNRQLHRLTYRLQPGLNGIALPSGDTFVNIHSVTNQKNQAYLPAGKGPDPENSDRVYTVREQGVGRFDQRDASALLYQLMELLRDEVTAFSAIGEDFLTSVLREISQNMARIGQKLGAKKVFETAERPFLTVRGDASLDTLSVAYWTTAAETANALPAGSKLQSYASAGINGAEIFLLTKTAGGKSRPDETAYVDSLRKNIITRNRLVTCEDIRAFCQADMGAKIKKLDVRPGFVLGNLPGQGMIRCLLVEIWPSGQADRQEWAWQCGQLQTKIQQRTAGLYPVKVISA